MKLSVEIFYIEIWHILSLIFFLAVNLVIVFQAKRDYLLKSFMVLQGTLFIWIIAKILKTVSPQVDLRWWFIVLQYLGVCYLSSTFLIFAYHYAKAKPMKRKWLIINNIVPTISFIMVLTNPFHHLFYSVYNFKSDSFGPYFYFHLIFSYLQIFLGLGLCIATYRKEKSHSYGFVKLLAIGTIFPLIFNVMYITKTYKMVFGHRPWFDYTPLCYNLSLLMFVIAIFRYRFLNISRIAKTSIFDHLSQGIIVYDSNEQLIDYNMAAERMVRNKDGEMPRQRDILSNTVTSSADRELLAYDYEITKNATEKFHIYRGDIFSKNKETIGEYWVINDVSEFNRLYEEFKETNKDLILKNSKLQVQNQIREEIARKAAKNIGAKNLHDILGHGFVLIIAMLESMSHKLTKEPVENIRKMVEEAESALREGIVELNESLLNHEEDQWLAVETFHDKMAGLIEGVKKLDLSISFTNRLSRPIKAEHAELFLRICQESMTNAIKHGKATELECIVRDSSKQIEIWMIDNGLGCSDCTKGYGLTEMEKQLNHYNGTLIISSEYNNGFMVRCVIAA